jgi:hypothetical protein
MVICAEAMAMREQAEALAVTQGHDIGASGLVWSTAFSKFSGSCLRCGRMLLVERDGRGGWGIYGGAMRCVCSPKPEERRRHRRSYFSSHKDGRRHATQPIRTSTEESATINPVVRRREHDAPKARETETGALQPPLRTRVVTGQIADQRPSTVPVCARRFSVGVYLPPPGSIAFSLLYRGSR